VDVPDTTANAAEFGRPGGGAGAGTFPQVRVVALAERNLSSQLRQLLSVDLTDSGVACHNVP
jgi:hypothetical protein